MELIGGGWSKLYVEPEMGGTKEVSGILSNTRLPLPEVFASSHPTTLNFDDLLSTTHNLQPLTALSFLPSIPLFFLSVASTPSWYIQSAATTHATTINNGSSCSLFRLQLPLSHWLVHRVLPRSRMARRRECSRYRPSSRPRQENAGGVVHSIRRGTRDHPAGGDGIDRLRVFSMLIVHSDPPVSGAHSRSLPPHQPDPSTARTDKPYLGKRTRWGPETRGRTPSRATYFFIWASLLA